MARKQEDKDTGRKHKNPLSKSIYDASWYSFFNMLAYKCDREDKIFHKIERFFASSQICSECGYKNPEVKDLSVREWTCPECGTHHNRDFNAAINIRNKGLEELLLRQGLPC